MLKLLHPVRQFLRPGLDEGWDDHCLQLVPESILTEHVMTVLLWEPHRFYHTDLWVRGRKGEREEGEGGGREEGRGGREEGGGGRGRRERGKGREDSKRSIFISL